MGSTPKRGLRYPEATVLANTLHTQIKNLAEDADLYTDYTTLSSGGGLQRYNDLCHYQESSPSLSGYVVVQTNLTFSNTMTRLHIQGWMYKPNNNIIDLVVTVYPFGDGSAVNVDVANAGSVNFSTVGFYTRNSDNKLAIVLGLESGAWEYPKLAVDGMFGHTFVDPLTILRTGWSITRVTSLSGYTLKTNAKFVTGASNTDDRILYRYMDQSNMINNTAPNNSADTHAYQVGPIAVPSAAKVVDVGMEYRFRAGINAACTPKLWLHWGSSWSQYGISRFHNQGDPTTTGAGYLRTLATVPAGAANFYAGVFVNVDSGGGAFTVYPAGATITFHR